SSSSKLSLSISNNENESRGDANPRLFSASKRFGGSESSQGGRSNPFNAISPLTTSAISSPTAGASSAFGLGTGAFASFGAANKTPKTPGAAFDFAKAGGAAPVPVTPTDRRDKASGRAQSNAVKAPNSSSAEEVTPSDALSVGASTPWPLKHSWVVWYRPPTSRTADYERSTKPLYRMQTAQQFWKIYVHLKRPSQLPTVSDYHFFKEGIRPVWEDEENKKGGKWVLRLKKGVCDRYWEELLMAMIGDQFAEASEEVCGAVLSVRAGEDVLSVWTRTDGGRNIKIRETLKRVLALPPDTIIVWKSHDDSIAQRSAIDQARQEKSIHHGSEKRRAPLGNEDSTPVKERTNAS
ncbi:IF4E-domain-containing protein, partial [Trichodelitschia bisporula]